MEATNVEKYLTMNAKYFPSENMYELKQALLEADDCAYDLISSIALKNPNTYLVISIFLGSYGVDRFLLGETGMGVLKLLTGGCCGVLTIIDWFRVQKRTREYNYHQIMGFIRKFKPINVLLNQE